MTEEDLMNANGGHWGKYPGYAVSDWKYEVDNDDTRQGYWAWVCSQLEQEKGGE